MGKHLVAFGIIATLISMHHAAACSTDPTETLEDAFRYNQIVVLAQVQSGERTAQSANYKDPAPVETVKFKVLLTWKGHLEPGTEITTVTPIGLGNCALSADPEFRMLIEYPSKKIPPGPIWILFIPDKANPQLNYDTVGSRRLGDGGEEYLGPLFDLAHHRHHRPAKP